MRSPSTFAHFECEPGSTIKSGASIGDSKNFRFLATHHIGLPGFVDIGKAGREMNAPAIGLDLRQMRGDLARAGRTFDVSRLAPAMPAADHAGGDDRQRRMSLEPMTGQALERRWIGSRRDAPDPVARSDLVEDFAIRRHEIGAKAGRSPVDGDEHGRHRAD